MVITERAQAFDVLIVEWEGAGPQDRLDDDGGDPSPVAESNRSSSWRSFGVT